MSRSAKIQSIIEETVSETFESILPGLRAEIVRRASEELESLEPAEGHTPTDLLRAAVVAIQESAAQAEILKRLLEGSARFCGRCALFVAKGVSVNGWQGIGFADNDLIRTLSLNASNDLIARALQGRIPVTGAPAEFDGAFLTLAGAPAEDHCLVLPLVVKEKVAAIIYADAGDNLDIVVDRSALTLLCQVTALWLELTALRRVGVGAGLEESNAAVTQPVAPPAVVVSQPHQAPVAQSVSMPPAHSAAVAVAAPAPAIEEDEGTRKARRFAKLLVDEIKLYNQNKVAEGRQNRDLYDRLREDIEKSRSTFDKRHGEIVGSGIYFNQELIRVLADNDVSLMGGNFPR